MQRPLHTLALADVSPAVASLFERAFAPPGASRPSAAEWHGALKGFAATLRVCPADAGHQTPAHVPGCVWCSLMKAGAPNFFVSVSFRSTSAGVRAASGFDLARVWGRIEAVPRPTRPYARPAVPTFAATPWPSHLPKAPLSPPAYPAILANPPAPPDPQLPPAVHKRATVPYSGLQNTATLAGIALAVFFIPAYFVGTVVAAQAVGRSAVGGWAVAAVFALAILGTAGWWLTLELDRRATQRRKNALYFAERDEHRAIADAQLAAWEAELTSQQARARAKYDELAKRAGDTLAAIRTEADRRSSRHWAAMAALTTAEQAWAAEVAHATGEFDRNKSELARLRDRHLSLAAEQQAAQQQLRARAREMQRDQYLQQVFLSDHEISGIGPVRLATLASFGIETAYDIEDVAITSIPGFGAKIAEKLIAWRTSVESAFVFNPSLGIPIQDQQALDFRFFQQRQPIEARLAGGEGELTRILASLEGKLKPIEEKIRQHLTEVGRASADLASIPAGF
jgi:DNA-binding helix-hairpin-helix protein with protein kinase domain